MNGKWYGGKKGTYLHTASGALDHAGKWQQILTAEPGGLNWMQYAGVYLPDGRWFSASEVQQVLGPWEHAGYRLILSVPLVRNPPAIKSYSGPPEPGNKLYQLAEYPDAVAALKQGAYPAGSG